MPVTQSRETAMSQLVRVEQFLRDLQQRICAALEAADGEGRFAEDVWQRKEAADRAGPSQSSAGTGTSIHGGGRSRLLKNGAVFEQAGVGFSDVGGASLPPSATAGRPQLAGAPWRALGVSLVLHPRNPYLPTTHANVRYFEATPSAGQPIWWFGGGFDLTPFYPFDEDVRHWHQTAHALCAPFGASRYSEHKAWCDRYFFLRHRNECRGVGGLFFDDLNSGDFERDFAYERAVGNGFLDAYLPIVDRRKHLPYGEREREFQLYRRGRYVEFNLVWDRGTLFGLQSGGRTESILMSLPPRVRFEYMYSPEPGSAEARLAEYLQPRDWLSESADGRQ